MIWIGYGTWRLPSDVSRGSGSSGESWYDGLEARRAYNASDPFRLRRMFLKVPDDVCDLRWIPVVPVRGTFEDRKGYVGKVTGNT